MTKIERLEQRAIDTFDYIRFGKNLVNAVQDKNVKRVANNLVTQLETIFKIYEEAIKKGENRNYSREELRGVHEVEFTEAPLHSWLSKEFDLDDEIAFKIMDEPEILAYVLLTIIRDKYSPHLKLVHKTKED